MHAGWVSTFTKTVNEFYCFYKNYLPCEYCYYCEKLVNTLSFFHSLLHTDIITWRFFRVCLFQLLTFLHSYFRSEILYSSGKSGCLQVVIFNLLVLSTEKSHSLQFALTMERVSCFLKNWHNVCVFFSLSLSLPHVLHTFFGKALWLWFIVMENRKKTYGRLVHSSHKLIYSQE